jgi:hypothetical protein
MIFGSILTLFRSALNVLNPFYYKDLALRKKTSTIKALLETAQWK